MARSTEIDLIQAAHRAAQARIALAIAYLSQVEWQGVSATNPAATAGPWVERSMRAIIVGRRRSIELSKSYYQLVRALDTGRVMGNPDLPDGTPITLPNLREHFLTLLQKNAQLGFGETGLGDADDSWVEGALSQALEPSNPRHDQFLRSDISDLLDRLSAAMDSDDPLLGVDRFEWPTDRDPQYLHAHLEPQLRQRAINSLEEKNRRRKEQELTRESERRAREKAHRESGSAGAGVVDESVTNAGRSLISYAVRRDTRVRMVARGTSATPCSFCAMLASRGFAYASEMSAVAGKHPNCHCYPIVRWKTVTDDDLPELNKFFKSQWPIVTKGYSGAAARRVWRQWIAKRTQFLLTNNSQEEPSA